MFNGVHVFKGKVTVDGRRDPSRYFRPGGQSPYQQGKNSPWKEFKPKTNLPSAALRGFFDEASCLIEKRCAATDIEGTLTMVELWADLAARCVVGKQRKVTQVRDERKISCCARAEITNAVKPAGVRFATIRVELGICA
ncbi:MAG: hypothetical protein ABL934_06225 [Lysobacteraceae bacterium]